MAKPLSASFRTLARSFRLDEPRGMGLSRYSESLAAIMVLDDGRARPSSGAKVFAPNELTRLMAWREAAVRHAWLGSSGAVQIGSGHSVGPWFRSGSRAP